MLRKQFSRKASISTDLEAAAVASAGSAKSSPSGSGKLQKRASFTLRSSLNTAKYSAALDAVKSEQDEEKDSLEDTRVWLKKFMSSSKFGSNYENMILLISFVSMIEFIYQTYLEPGVANDSRDLYRLKIVELVFIAFFFVDWCLNFFIADDKSRYFLR